MATKKTKRYDYGGDVTASVDPAESEAKQRGLAESNKEAPVGFFERLRMGNIDDPNSEAYKRFGAGRGRAASVPVEDRTGTPVKSDVDTANASGDSIAALNKPRNWTPEETSDSAPSKISAPTESSKPAKPSPAKSESGKDGRGAVDMSAYKPRRDSRPYTNESERGAAAESTRANIKQQIASGSQAVERDFPELNVVTPGLGRINALAKGLASKFGGKAAEATGRAVSTGAETPVTFLGKTEGRAMNAPRLPGKSTEVATTEGGSAAKAIESAPPKVSGPQKKLAGPKDKADNVKEAARKLSEQDKKAQGRATRDLAVDRAAWLKGPSAMKRGGAVGFAKGGFVARRGDGIAQRGKTKGVMR